MRFKVRLSKHDRKCGDSYCEGLQAFALLFFCSLSFYFPCDLGDGSCNNGSNADRTAA